LQQLGDRTGDQQVAVSILTNDDAKYGPGQAAYASIAKQYNLFWPKSDDAMLLWR